jgi:2-polyprenyl-3-methyl-5-hydroxy-6-metoxy-1,4-benzoquinol methylase
MSGSDVDRIRHERLEADARYNHALTALDQTIVNLGSRPLSREDFDRLAAALIVFLQQITAFVESSDRQISGDIGARLERLERAVASSTDELRTQLNLMHRALAAVGPGKGSAPTSSASNHQSAIGDQSTINNQSAINNQSTISNQQSALSDYRYLAFEDQFRGSAESVQARVRDYVPIFHGSSGVVDLGCGRGELLAALKTAGIEARGVDTNAQMVAVAREQGLDVSHHDALGYLRSVADESIGGVIATQVVEHLEPAYLVQLLDTAAQKMRPGAPIVLETINPACWLAFFSSYIRDVTHVRPVHPETLQYLLRASGFERVELRYSAPVPDHIKMRTVDLPAAILSSPEPQAVALARVAHAINANAAVLNNLMFTHLDYAAVALRS